MARVILSRAKVEMGDLPSTCARCGAPDAVLTPLLLPYLPTTPGQKLPRWLIGAAHHPAGAALGSVLGLGVLLHGLCTGRRLALRLPLCDQHQLTARRHAGPLRLAILLLACLSIVATVLAVYATVSLVRQGANMRDWGLHWAYWIAAFVCACGALLIRANIHDNFISLLKVTDEEVELSGVGKGFVQALDR